MTRITGQEVMKVFFVALAVNTLFSLFLMTWVTKKDISNLPEEPFNKFLHLFYFSVVSFTTTGYGDITPKSNRLKIVMVVYLLLIIAGAFSFFFDF
jgi:quinol-cytochrome oxidoreductase complex cytochrome b subunit